jgi:serum/glucocorticoid-regulated kinase 2
VLLTRPRSHGHFVFMSKVRQVDSPGTSLTIFSIHTAPTHNLTLTRTAFEIHTLDAKLRDAHPALPIPPIPLDAADAVAPIPGNKRRPSFLTTLSRLASPNPKQRPPALPTSKDASEHDDNPFVSSPHSASSALAAYLTTLSNDQIIRVSKHWKRFVRVRTDDLQSVRVERAIKRVRSDAAIHGTSVAAAGSGSLATAALLVETPDANQSDESIPPVLELDSAARPVTPDRPDKSLLEDENTAVAAAMATAMPEITPSPSPIMNASKPSQLSPEIDTPEAPVEQIEQIGEAGQTSEQDVEVTMDPTPGVPAEAVETALAPASPLAQSSHKSVHRIPRSASADPVQAGRLSRALASSVPVPDTDDESTGARSRNQLPGEPQSKKSTRKVCIDDFEMMRVLGKGCAGKVLLVRHKASSDMYALKAITKRHVLAHQELEHTRTEQAVLKRMAREGADPFVVKLWWSFHDKENLFLVMDFHPGGDLATQLARWGRLGRDRARFYAAEIVEGVEGLHRAGVIYRDLKPENILIGVDGHIVLTDFGLSKEFPRSATNRTTTAPATPSGSRDEYYSSGETSATTPYRTRSDWYTTIGGDTTSTFCGTAEYLAPEVIQGLPYSYDVDWWSFGTMLFEMLTGIVSGYYSLPGAAVQPCDRPLSGLTITLTCMFEFFKTNFSSPRTGVWTMTHGA